MTPRAGVSDQFSIRSTEQGQVFVGPAVLEYGDIEYGRYCVIGANCKLIGVSSIRIGAFCFIGSNCHLVTHENHLTELPSTYIFGDVFDMDWTRGCGLRGLDENKEESVPAPIQIGSDVFLGPAVTVCGGVTIGDGCIVRESSFVNRDCEPFGIYQGTPARKIGTRFDPATANRVAELAWWNWDLDQIRANSELFGVVNSETIPMSWSPTGLRPTQLAS